MLERFRRRVENEKRFVPEPKIRLHHLKDWCKLIKLLSRDRKADVWNSSETEIDQTRFYIQEFSEEVAWGYVWVRKNLEAKAEKQGLDSDERSDLRYMIDIVGKDESDYLSVAEKWTRHFLGIFDAVLSNKNTPITLFEGKDGICMGCARGRHCTDPFLRRFRANKDTAFEQALLGYIGENTNNWASEGKLGRSKEGDFLITGELLFNLEFHELLDAEAKKLYPKIFKDADLVYNSQVAR